MLKGNDHDHPRSRIARAGAHSWGATLVHPWSDSSGNRCSPGSRRVCRTLGRRSLSLLVIGLVGCTSTQVRAPAPTASPLPKITSPSPISSSPSAAVIHASNWPVPNDTLTPGAIVPGCTYPRPARSPSEVTSSERTAILKAYHYTGPTGLAAYELDHRIPYSLCGLGGVGLTKNLWPEPADGIKQSTFIHNRKDQLEKTIASLVQSGKRTLAQAQAIFMGDWRSAWCTYVHKAGVIC